MQLVMYRRHKRRSMRFYAFNFKELDILPSQESPEVSTRPKPMISNQFLQADFTRSGSPGTRRGTALDGEVLSQVRDIFNRRWCPQLI